MSYVIGYIIIGLIVSWCIKEKHHYEFKFINYVKVTLVWPLILLVEMAKESNWI